MSAGGCPTGGAVFWAVGLEHFVSAGSCGLGFGFAWFVGSVGVNFWVGLTATPEMLYVSAHG